MILPNSFVITYIMYHVASSAMISQPCYERFSCTHYYCTVYYPLTESDTSTTVLNEFPPTRFFLQKRKKSVGRRSCRRRIFLIHRKVYGIWMKKVDLVFASKSWRPSWDLFSYIRIGPGSGLVRAFGSTSYPIVPI